MGQALTFFPTPADDETIYSVCSRFHQVAGRLNSRCSSALLLGHPEGGAEIDLVGGLLHLEAASEGAIKASEATLRQRTVLRSYMPFMGVQRRRSVVMACSASAQPLPTRIARGLSWSGSLLEHQLRFCPYCAKEQESRGFSYWVTDHQLPGIWVCRKHDCSLLSMSKRGQHNANWARVATVKVDTRPTPSSNTFDALCRIASCIEWLSGHRSVNLEILLMQFRARMRQCGHSRSDVKVTDMELHHLHRAMENLTHSGIPHFEGYAHGNWMRMTIKDFRFAHPLHWALLLAYTGDVSHTTLSQEYEDAHARLPELELFENEHGTRRARAPMCLYRAMEQFVALGDCARYCALGLPEIQRWLRRDSALVEHRKAAEFQIKHRAAVQSVEGARLHNPDLTRVGVLRRVNWAFRWLEQNDPELLNRLAPAPYGRQRMLFGTSTTSRPSAVGQ